MREKRVDISCGAINKLIGSLDDEEDDYLVLMEERMDTTELVRKLCQSDKEVI